MPGQFHTRVELEHPHEMLNLFHFIQFSVFFGSQFAVPVFLQ